MSTASAFLEGLLASTLELLRHGELWKYASIPIVAGLVGWLTNWAAIVLTFRPLEFVGFRPYLGWQGIIPQKAAKMAGVFVDSTMSRLGTLPELFQQMEPEAIARQIVRVIDPRLESYADAIVSREHATLWRSTPALAKAQVYARIRERFPHRVSHLLAEASEEIADLIDFKHMITTRLVEDRALLNRLFLESGDREFKFIIRSGLYLGFLFGLVQLAVWLLYPAAWVLPAFGVLVGFATNWIALNVIFRPLNPVRVGPFTFQGLFLKRQLEVARVWCHLVTREIVTIRALVHAMLSGPKAANTQALIQKHMMPIVQDAVGPLGLPIELAVGKRSLESMTEEVGQTSIKVGADPFDDWHFNRDRAQVVERLLRQRMENLSPEEFQDLLRPCFQEDELKLILVGAALGGLAGTAQLFLVFGGG